MALGPLGDKYPELGSAKDSPRSTAGISGFFFLFFLCGFFLCCHSIEGFFPGAEELFLLAAILPCAFRATAKHVFGAATLQHFFVQPQWYSHSCLCKVFVVQPQCSIPLCAATQRRVFRVAMVQFFS